MAKPQKQPDPIRARKSTTGKAPTAKPPPAKAAARAPLVKASSVKPPPKKAPAARARGWRPTAPPAAKGRKLPVTKVTRSTPRKGSSTPEQPPATEAQIVEALTGKLTAPGAGSRAGLSWLAGPAKSKPDVEEPEKPKALPADPPPAATCEPTEAEPKPEIPVPAEPVTDAAEAPVVMEPKEETTMAVASGAEKPVSKEWLPMAAANVRSLGKMLQVTGARIGWTLTVQAGAFVAFCVLVAKDAPLSGLQQFLPGAIPVFAMILLCAGLASCHAAQLMLDKLEAERLRWQQLQAPLPAPPPGADSETKTDSLTNLRRLAYWPPLVILGILLVVWLCLGLTVWFL